MSQSFTLNPKQTVDLDRSVAAVNVHIGTALVSLPNAPEKPNFLEADGDPLDCGNVAPVTIYSPDSAVVDVLYSDEVAAGEVTDEQLVAAIKKAFGGGESSEPKASKPKRKRATRGDTGGGDSGGFESRTVKQLQAECKKRKIKVKSKASKADLIAALRKGS